MKPTLQVQRYVKTKVGGYVDKTNSKPAGQPYDRGESGELAPEVKAALAKIDMLKVILEYPDSSYSKLVSAICKKYELKRENVTVGTGANEILDRIARTYLDSADKCVLIHPTFFRIEDASVRCTSNIIDVYLKEKNDYRVTEVELNEVKNLKDVKLIWVCTPNNPTGTIVPRDYIKQMAEAHPNSLICVDEAYGEYAEIQSATELLKDHDNIIVVKSLSKCLGLAGLVVGYALGNEKLIAPLQAMRLEYPINGIAAELAHIALSSEEYIKKLAENIAKERVWLGAVLSGLDGVTYVPSNTNLLLVKHARIDLYIALLNKGILVANMNNLKGAEGQKYVRITISGQHEKNEVLLNAIKELLGSGTLVAENNLK